MFYLTLVIILCVYLRCIVSENQYVFIDKNRTWTDAIAFCREEGGSLSALDEENIEHVLQGCLKNDSVDLWTNTFRQASPYLSLTGCFEVHESMNFITMNRPLVVDCQYHCRSTSTFAVMDNKCACLEDGDVTGLRVNAGFCNITCIEEMYCGGKDYMNIYDVVEQSYLDGAMLLEDPDYTSCLTYQCLNNSYTLTERDCEDPSIADVACDDYFSCTFEFGESCFLIDLDFDWKVTNTITIGTTTIRAYEGSLFASLEDALYSIGYKSYLLSNIDFPAKKWCIRFGYFISSVDKTANITVFIYKSTQVPDNVIYEQALNGESQYAAVNIDSDNVFKIGFRTVKSTEVSIFAIDDVTMIAGTCEETTAQLLYMKGEIRCNFERSVDLCFNQSKDDDFDWSIGSGGMPTMSTGPGNSYEGKYYSYIEANDGTDNDVARLESRFDLQDVNVTFSMRYYMFGRDIRTLIVFLRNKAGRNRTIFSKSRQQGDGWIYFENTFIVEGTWQLCIEANVFSGSQGDIAIDDIRIRLNQNDFKKTWLNLNERCIRSLGSYSLTKDQVPNTSCLSNDRERWTGIVKPQRNGRTDRDLERSPKDVRLLQYSRTMSSHTWEVFDKNTNRPFVCEKERMDLSKTCSVYEEKRPVPTYASEESSEMLLIIVPAVAGTITLLVVIIVVVDVNLRRKRIKYKEHDNQSDSEVSYTNIAMTLSTQIGSTENKTQNVSIPATTEYVEMAGPHSVEEYVNKEVENIRLRTQPADNDAKLELENPEHYEEMTVEVVEPKYYDHHIMGKVEPASYENIITEKMELASYEEPITKTKEPATYEELIMIKKEPASYEELKYGTN